MTVPQQEPRWRKARRSQNEGACVEVHPAGAIRDSKHPASELRLDWASLVAAAKADRLNN